jgi:UDP-N-acetyl-D-mannosaminuronic acid dehydrogenase
MKENIVRVNHVRIASVNVIGMGYIGLPTAAILANSGLSVLGVDVRADVVAQLSSGSIHIHEPGLEALVRAAFAQQMLRASLQIEAADAHIIAVPTPVNPDRSPDLSYVIAATETIATVLRQGDLVVLESTVPPATCVGVIAPLLEQRTGLVAGKDYDLAHCPERVIPGQILKEIVENDRIIGGTTPEATRRTVGLYESFVTGKILETDASTAEMCKLMENTFRDVNIALANELAQISERIGVDVHEAIQLANRHPRVNLHTPGIGVGGHCIPVDPWFIIHAAPGEAQLLRAARKINDARPHALAQQILNKIETEKLDSVAFFGLSYKADVDDFRESPAIEIVEIVTKATKARVFIVEPYLSALPNSLASATKITLDQALEQAALLIPLVGHREFKELDTARLKNKKIIDAIRIWNLAL